VPTQQSQPGGERGVVRGQQAPVAESAQVLGGVETKATHVAPAPRGTIGILGANRLRSVLDHHEGMLAGERQQWFHFGALAVEVHGNDRLRGTRD